MASKKWIKGQDLPWKRIINLRKNNMIWANSLIRGKMFRKEGCGKDKITLWSFKEKEYHNIKLLICKDFKK